MFEKLATGKAVAALGLVPQDGFWLAVALLVISAMIEISLLKLVSDRRVLGAATVSGVVIALGMVSLACMGAGLLLLFY